MLKTDVARLEQLLDEKPASWLERLVLADALEEEGRTQEATFQRFLAQHHIAPEYNTIINKPDVGWYWYSYSGETYNYLTDSTKGCHCLGISLWHIVRPEGNHNPMKCRKEAEERLRSVLERLGYERCLGMMLGDKVLSCR